MFELLIKSLELRAAVEIVILLMFPGMKTKGVFDPPKTEF